VSGFITNTNNMFESKVKLNKKRKEFVELQDKLQRADIILVRNKERYNIVAKGIQSVTKSYWNHAALVFTIKQKNPLFHNTIIIEALGRGMELRRLDKYTSRPDKFDVGVKRIPGLSIDDQRKIRAYIMRNVDVPYDFPRIIGFFFGLLTGNYNEYLVNNDSYICSSFIQGAFYHSINREDKKILFRKVKEVSETTLGYTSPGDLAKSSESEWIYNRHR
jgi:hypothetical protein